ncbi:MAG: hypothetical protein ACYCSN_06670 [Acidobacteriaceae bacterium]
MPDNGIFTHSEVAENAVKEISGRWGSSDHVTGSLRGKFKRAGWDDRFLFRLLEMF